MSTVQTSKEEHPIRFDQLNLIEPLLKAVREAGYESPSPIQAQTIPLLLQGRDLVGQAQTGTGKTAAFALPLLSGIDLARRTPQLLVLAPTRELAIQVAEAFQSYARFLKGFHVLPIYGGQSYDVQLKQLRRGVHVVVGTPGRVMDHLRRGTLTLDGLSALVLDEADEMLRMGFIDDVTWILEQTPKSRQIALFSATMPPAIRKIAESHLNHPAQVTIRVKQATADTIRQRYWTVSHRHKLDALTRILEAESFDAMIIFVRTKTATEALAEKLEARGFAVAALNGDITQKQRENTVNRLKKGHVDILVATDVVARGLDVERISHVINYDIPHDTESYVHRIGRTGRAGRDGDAILFVAPRENRMLYAIERATKTRIEKFDMPSTQAVNDKRIAAFKQQITDTLESGEDMSLFAEIIEQYRIEHNASSTTIATALAKMVQGENPLLLEKGASESKRDRSGRNPRFDAPEDRRKSMRNLSQQQYSDADLKPRRCAEGPGPERGMERYRMQVGASHGVKAGNIVGAIANELGLESEFIGRVQIEESESWVDLPEGMPKSVFQQLQQIQVCGHRLNAEAEQSRDQNARAVKQGSRPSRGGRNTQRRAGGSRKFDSGSGRGRAGGRKPPRRK